MFRHSLVLMLLAAATILPAQNQDDHEYKLGVNVELVQLPISVLDKKGFPIRGLHPEHFAVYEDKVLQDISLVQAGRHTVKCRSRRRRQQQHV